MNILAYGCKHIAKPTKHLVGLIQAGLMRGPGTSSTLPAQIEQLATTHADAVMLRYQERTFSYAEANRIINRHAAVHRMRGIQRGDVVVLWMENRPEFLWHFLALGKLGAVASLVNTHLSGKPLQHAIETCEPRAMIVGSELWPRFLEIRTELPQGAIEASVLDVDGGAAAPPGADLPVFQALAAEASEQNPPETSQIGMRELAAYIYTSGTTGLPKAALVSHERVYRAGKLWGGMVLALGPGETVYVCLPLYHSNALLLGTASAISYGATVALARKFSVTHFWEDIRTYGATRFVYIGELCRYLMNAPPSPKDRDHRVTIVTGNGLRPDIWRGFKRRFGLRHIREFYASTEGNAITFNYLGVPGAVGVYVPFMMRIAAWDDTAQDFIRDEHGYLVEAKVGESGVLLGRIGEKLGFSGYTNREATERKVLRDAFAPGDAWFNTGDLLKRDRLGHLYFVDRLGDTFRWKGENVSTTEVQEQLSSFAPVAQVAVFGVKLPHAEGRAGMAALVLIEGERFDPDAFAAHVQKAVPAYARPLFVRLCDGIETTSTHKLKKGELQNQGYDLDRVSDPIYFWDVETRRYVLWERELQQQLESGALRL